MKRAILLLPLIWVSIGLPQFAFAEALAGAAQLGRYACRVDEVYGTDELGKRWKNARLIYDADAGTLEGSFDPWGELTKKGMELPPERRLFSRLKVETVPSSVNNLIAVQYDPVGYRANIRPMVAWLMLETLGDPIRPRFKFFSNTIRVVTEGRCVRGQ